MNCLAAYAVVQADGTDAQVARYAPLVKRIAHHLMGRLPQTVQVDDLIQAGMIGLLEALKHYEEGHGASFETYAGIRIRGAMLDEVRRNDWVPRSVHRKSRQVAEAIHAVEIRKGCSASDKEVAEVLDVSLAEYHQLLQDASGQKLFSLNELTIGEDAIVEHIPDGTPGAVEQLQDDQFQRALADAIAGLPERERLILALYYDEELNLKEIGAVLGVTESRVCQIHSQAMLRLRGRLGEWRQES